MCTNLLFEVYFEYISTTNDVQMVDLKFVLHIKTFKKITKKVELISSKSEKKSK
jgi:hypothetical protein